MSSTPTDEKPKKYVDHVCDGKLYASEDFCPVHGQTEDERPWWYWFRIEIPEPKRRPEFFLMLISIIATEVVLGLIIGNILRGIFGWPF